jgi:hypothetical protein
MDVWSLQVPFIAVAPVEPLPISVSWTAVSIPAITEDDPVPPRLPEDDGVCVAVDRLAVTHSVSREETRLVAY